MYSIDFRVLTLKYYKRYRSCRKAAKIMEIHYSTVSRWVKSISYKKRVQRPSVLVERYKQFIRSCLDTNPLCSHDELKELVNKQFDCQCSLYIVRRCLHSIRYTKKRVKRKRRPTTSSNHDMKRIFDSYHNVVFVDESCFSNRHSWLRGYAPSGKECVLPILPTIARQSLTLLAQQDGTYHYKTVSNSVKSTHFIEFLNELTLPVGTCIVADNCAIHKTKLVRKAIHEKGWDICFIPPYSPDYNPVEHCFAWLKQRYRKHVSRGSVQLHNLVESLPQSVIQHSFEHITETLKM